MCLFIIEIVGANSLLYCMINTVARGNSADEHPEHCEMQLFRTSQVKTEESVWNPGEGE